MSAPKVEQRRVLHRGREFHFVSYEAQVAKPARQQPALEPMWFLMNAGKRWAVMPHQPGQAPDEIDQLLTSWLETNIFS